MAAAPAVIAVNDAIASHIDLWHFLQTDMNRQDRQ
jgi:hypothetical protein